MWKPLGAPQDVAHLAGIELLQRLEEERGQAPGGAPPEAAALGGVGRVGIGRGDLGEVGAAAQLRERGECPPAALLDLLVVRLGGTRTSTWARRNSESARGLLRLPRELGVHLRVGDHDRVLHLALAQAREHDLRADVLAEARVTDAVALERLAEVRHREVVFLGDAARWSGRG
jgi:hypothetical protein